MRTTIKIDDQLLAQAKTRAAESGRTLSSVVEEALREALARRAAPRSQKVPMMQVYRGGRMMPGVDLDDSAALLEEMERAGA